ncbi:MAG: putative disease resistance protein [Chthoniobacter sp.]|nr:putative disease resistance protein [Chthoniobacter sp.]
MERPGSAFENGAVVIFDPMTPGAVKTKRRKRLALTAGLLALICLAAVFATSTVRRARATKELRAFGFQAGSPGIIAMLRLHGRKIFDQKTWEWRSQVRLMNSDTANLDGFGPALRAFKPRRVLLGFCSKLEDVEILRAFPKLERLDFYQCPNVQGLEIVSEFKHLKELTFAYHPTLRSLSMISSGKRLESLHIMNCPALDDYGKLRELTGLRSLYLTGSPALKDTEVLRGLIALEELDLSGSGELSDLSGLHELKSLKTVQLRGCPKVTAKAVAVLRAKLPNATISIPIAKHAAVAIP